MPQVRNDYYCRRGELRDFPMRCVQTQRGTNPAAFTETGMRQACRRKQNMGLRFTF